MDVLHSVSIPAGFTQCRWSTSREPSSPLQCETEYLFFPFLPPRSLPHHLTSDPLLSRIAWNGVSNESHRSTSLTPSTFPFSSSSLAPCFLLLLPRLPGGVVICPLRGVSQSPAVWPPHRMTHGGTARLSSPPPSLDQVTRLSPRWLPFPTFSCATLKTDHAIKMKPAKWPTGPLPTISTTCVGEMLRSALADSKVLALGLEFDGWCSKVRNAACQAYTSLSWKPCCLGC